MKTKKKAPKPKPYRLMQRILQGVIAALVMLALAAPPLGAVQNYYVYKDAALTTTSTVISFGFQASGILIINRNAVGGTVLYIDWASGTADSADDELLGGAAIEVAPYRQPSGAIVDTSSVAIACASGTCSVKVLAVR